MDELLNDFLIETNEHIEAAGELLVTFEREPSNKGTITKIFRLIHTIKGTCGFLGLSRLEQLAHVAEALIGRLRDGAPATPDTVSAILASVDRVKFILGWLEKTGKEPEGEDTDLIDVLQLRIATLAALSPSPTDVGAGLESNDDARRGSRRRRSWKSLAPLLSPISRTGRKRSASRSAPSSASCCSCPNWF